jgi:hypothetical protein
MPGVGGLQLQGAVPIGLAGGLNLLGGGQFAGGMPGQPGGAPAGGLDPIMQQQLLLQQNPAIMQAILARQQAGGQGLPPGSAPPGSAPGPH